MASWCLTDSVIKWCKKNVLTSEMTLYAKDWKLEVELIFVIVEIVKIEDDFSIR